MNALLKLLLPISICSTLILPRAAEADGTNRIGVLTVSYVLTASGSGAWYWDDPGAYGFSGNDSLQLSIGGEVQYAVMQTVPISLSATSSARPQQQSATGSDSTQNWDPPPTTEGGRYFASDPVQPHQRLRHPDQRHASTNRFLGVCEKVSFGASQSSGFYTWDKAWQPDNVAWPPFFDVGTMCAIQGMDNVRLFTFTLTNSALPWTQTLTTNAAVSSELTDWDGSANGNSTTCEPSCCNTRPTCSHSSTMPPEPTARRRLPSPSPRPEPTARAAASSARCGISANRGTDTSHFKGALLHQRGRLHGQRGLHQ